MWRRKYGRTHPVSPSSELRWRSLLWSHDSGERPADRPARGPAAVQDARGRPRRRSMAAAARRRLQGRHIGSHHADVSVRPARRHEGRSTSECDGAVRRGRIILSVGITGFLVGTGSHIVDLAIGGLNTYAQFPTGLRIYWVSLTLLDPLTIALLASRRRVGTVLALGGDPLRHHRSSGAGSAEMRTRTPPIGSRRDLLRPGAPRPVHLEPRASPPGPADGCASQPAGTPPGRHRREQGRRPGAGVDPRVLLRPGSRPSDRLPHR